MIEGLVRSICIRYGQVSDLEEKISHLEQVVDDQSEELEYRKKELRKKTNRVAELEDANQQYREEIPSAPIDVEPVEVSAGDVARALRELDGFEDVWLRWPMNRAYKIISVEEFEEIVDQESVAAKEYVDDYFDCVDFTRAFTGVIANRYQLNSIGSVITRDGYPHKFNVVILEDNGEVVAKLFEPQNDQFVEPDDHQMYSLDGALFLI